METTDLKRQIIEKGVRQVLEEAKVPQSMHLRVVRALHEAMAKHKEDIVKFGKMHKKYKEDVVAHEERDKNHEETVKSFIEELQNAKNHDWTGPQGEPGKDGEDAKEVDIEALAAQVLSRIPVPKDGKDGNHGKDGLDADVEKVVNVLLQRIQKGDVIHINHVRGAAAFIKDGIKYRTEELMHGGGTKEYVPTGTIDGSNTTFTLPFPSSNWKVYADGARQRATADYTIAGVTLVFTFAPTTTVICDN